MEHTEWLTATTGDDSAREIGRRTGISFRTITSQITRDKISAENVITIAIEYGAHPVTALVDCGYLPEQFATTADPYMALRTLDDVTVAEEVVRRMGIARDRVAFTTPIDELEARRSDDHTPNVEPLGYVADSSPDEPEEGDEGYHDGP